MEDFGFLRDLAIILIATKIFGLFTRRLKAPQVVGQILAGLLIGPCLLGWVSETPFINKMAEIGVIMLMFQAGLETDLQQLKKTGFKATLIALVGVIVPMIFGTLTYMWFYGFAPVGDPEFFKALFMGTIMAATSVSITAAVLKELGKLNGIVGTTVTSAAIIDDVIGIVVLTMVLGAAGEGTHMIAVLDKVAIFFGLTFAVGTAIYYVLKWYDGKYPHTRRIPIIGLCFCFATAYIAETYFGIADITGAYIAGVVMCSLNDAGYVERRVDITSYMMFSPIFFAGIGLKTSFNFAGGMKFIWFCVAFVVLALAGKVIGCGLCSRACKFDKSDSLKIGVGMMTRGEVALITAQKGLEVGMMDASFFTPVILLIIVSSIVTPLVLKDLYAKDPKHNTPSDIAY